MLFPLVLGLYRVLLPVFLLVSLPGWLVRMGRRGGFGSGLRERFSIYRPDLEDEPCGAVHLHAVSVGETMIAVKLIRAWQAREPGKCFVLATGTATGHAVGVEAALPGVRVTYAPVDFKGCVNRYLGRFEPSQIVLVEGEAWPHLLLACRKRGIPVRLVNARLSPRSERRYRKLAAVIRPVFGMLDAVAAQEPADIARWEAMGVAKERIAVTGSSKFDPGAAVKPAQRVEFAGMLESFGAGRPVVLAASTHAGEEAWIGQVVRESGALFAVVPRHAERRAEVKADLEKEGFEVVLRSAFHPPADPAKACLVIDSTGELRDWTAHATVVVIGKTILGTGGQNPAEAILARRP
jgi:3-deoxy-D-manno-octulosonic-acid transferase